MAIPARNQLIDHDGLDERCVIEHFNGKTVDDAYCMFAENASFYCEDITYMSLVALDYYLPAAFAYLRSDDADGDWECASGVMTALSGMCARPDLSPSVVVIIRGITNYIANNLKKFDADDDWVPIRIAEVRKHIPESDAPIASGPATIESPRSGARPQSK